MPWASFLSPYGTRTPTPEQIGREHSVLNWTSPISPRQHKNIQNIFKGQASVKIAM